MNFVWSSRCSCFDIFKKHRYTCTISCYLVVHHLWYICVGLYCLFYHSARFALMGKRRLTKNFGIWLLCPITIFQWCNSCICSNHSFETRLQLFVVVRGINGIVFYRPKYENFAAFSSRLSRDILEFSLCLFGIGSFCPQFKFMPLSNRFLVQVLNNGWFIFYVAHFGGTLSSLIFFLFVAKLVHCSLMSVSVE